MNKFHFLNFLFILISTSTQAQTQAQMNQEAINEYKKTDAQLNLVYNQLIKKLDSNQKSLLINAQKKWISFRDVQCKFEIKEYDGGTIQPVIKYNCLMNLTNDRIETLKEILKDFN